MTEQTMTYLATLIQKVREHGKWPDMPKWYQRYEGDMNYDSK